MVENDVKIIHPVSIIKEAFNLWNKNFVLITFIGSVSVFLSHVLSIPEAAKMPLQNMPSSVLILFCAKIIIFLVINPAICLAILNYLKARQEVSSSVSSALYKSLDGFGAYLKACLLVFAFIFSLVIFGALFFTAGIMFYNTSNVNLVSLKIPLLLAFNALAVVLLIIGMWFGFFFGLAPLIAVFEKRGPMSSMIESRKVIRGNALRLLAVYFLGLICYGAVGVSIYFLITRFTHQKDVLNMVDPLVAILVAPFIMVVWLISYQKLRGIKRS